MKNENSDSCKIQSDIVTSIALPLILGLYIFVDAYPALKIVSFLQAATIVLCVEAIFISEILVIDHYFAKKRIKYTALFCFISFSLLYYGRYINIIQVFSLAFGRTRFLLPLFVIGFSLSVLYIMRTKRQLRVPVQCASVVLIAVTGYALANYVAISTTANSKREIIAPSISHIEKINLSYKPDVYYIICDAYTSSRSLQEYWNYDNSGFEADLVRRGFYIASNSQSFFPSTYISMASTFNMTNELAYTRLRILDGTIKIRNNAVLERFTNLGYRIMNISLFDLGSSKKYYSFFDNYSLETIGDKLARIASQSLPKIFFDLMYIAENDMSKKNIAMFHDLGDIPSSQIPIFVYAHFMTPHTPMGLDENGKLIPIQSRHGGGDKAAYLKQLKGTNVLLIAAIDSVLSKYPAGKEPIIVIQGDHGYRNLDRKKYGDKEKFTIMNAYHFPKGGNENVYQTITPYNTFRVLFDTYFGGEYELLDDLK